MNLTTNNRFVKLFLAIMAAVCISTAATADPPAGYYDSATGSGATLKAQLNNIINKVNDGLPGEILHNNVGYNNAWAHLGTIWEVPGDTTRVIMCYVGDSRLKTEQCSTSCNDNASFTGSWNREHVFPQSEFGGEPMESDLHALWPCDADVNNWRSNQGFRLVVTNLTTGLNGTGCKDNNVGFEPRDAEKGDIARALFYMAVRYEGEGGEADLEIIPQHDNLLTTDGKIGDLATLLAWHIADPVDQAERDRNDAVFTSQSNRNPFIDHPEWVAQIWSSIPPPPNVWINEIHYDNTGADVDEGVELAGTAGINLTNWRAELYNGTGGVTYTPLGTSTTTIPDQQNGYGTVWIPIGGSGIQNGAPDGLTLLSPDGLVVQFLSYEGSFAATNGSAIDLTSIDIGVSETGTEAVGMALQLIGTGTQYSDFTWSGPIAHTRGQPNTGQTFPAVSRVNDWPMYE